MDLHRLGELELSPGDVVVLYTDRITGAEDIHGEQHRIQRLYRVMRRAHAPAADVTRFIGAHQVSGDITTAVIKRR